MNNDILLKLVEAGIKSLDDKELAEMVNKVQINCTAHVDHTNREECAQKLVEEAKVYLDAVTENEIRGCHITGTKFSYKIRS
ncbi:hypothetical protein DdX_02129 [Ditylenchus destructor]|uniref:Uncharacterized protein n=1 Tax=Ditylenchus destructor TaxID=166010 RepID=A0AAD4NFJ4_9BILA|nr:hypothetical protein DdX_02129 [Ditylenchus destructor]